MLDAVDWTGPIAVVIGGEGPPTLLVFHQPHCLECQEIPAALDAIAAEAARIGLVEEVGDLEGIVAAIAANEPASLAALKQALRLAAAGTRSDGGQDRAFDALFGGEALARRLEALRRK